MMIERIPHTELHNFAKAMGLQPSQAKVKGTKISKTDKELEDYLLQIASKKQLQIKLVKLVL